MTTEFTKVPKDFLTFDKLTLRGLIIVLAVIVGVLPMLLTLPSLFPSADFSLTGQIGDTIGGITSPFINAISAIILFLAFREQINANKIQADSLRSIREGENRRVVHERLVWLKRDEYNIHELANGICIPAQEFRITEFNKATYLLFEIDNVLYHIVKNLGNDPRLIDELRVLYRILYEFDFRRIYGEREPLLTEINLRQNINEQQILETNVLNKFCSVFEEVEQILMNL